jgi:hypothetical protein
MRSALFLRFCAVSVALLRAGPMTGKIPARTQLRWARYNCDASFVGTQDDARSPRKRSKFLCWKSPQTECEHPSAPIPLSPFATPEARRSWVATRPFDNRRRFCGFELVEDSAYYCKKWTTRSSHLDLTWPLREKKYSKRAAVRARNLVRARKGRCGNRGRRRIFGHLISPSIRRWLCAVAAQCGSTKTQPRWTRLRY